MAVFFGGRLLITPVTASVIDDSALANRNLTVGNVLALLGTSEGGKPNTPLRFGSPSDAKAVLRSGELLTAVEKAFDPSAQTGGPSVVVAIRVNPATQSTLTLLDGASAAVINLASTDYGLYTSQIKVKVENGTTTGKKVTTQLGNDFVSQDNLARNAFLIRYTGAQLTASMSITGTTITLEAPNGSAVTNIDLNTFKTYQQVVDRINSVTGFNASVLDGNGALLALNGLDYVTSVDVRTADYTAKANLQAIVDWINGQAEGYVTATRVSGVGTLPANIGFTYLAGGINGSTLTGNWSDGYTTLQSQDVQWVTPVTSEPAIHAMNDAHCAFMSGPGRSERRGIVGMALGTTDSAAITAAKALGSDRTSLVHLGFNDFDANGNLVLLPPYILAAMIGGAFAGSNPGTALTNKTLKLRGIERNLRNPTDTDVLIPSGVLCVEETATGFKVVQSVSTWLANRNFNRVEVSCGAALDFTARNVRNALDVLRGEKGSPILLSRAVSITDSTLRLLSQPEPQGPGVLVGNADNPPYKNITASIDGDVLAVQYQCSPVIPANYITISIFAVPFTGSLAA